MLLLSSSRNGSVLTQLIFSMCFLAQLSGSSERCESAEDTSCCVSGIRALASVLIVFVFVLCLERASVSALMTVLRPDK